MNFAFFMVILMVKLATPLASPRISWHLLSDTNQFKPHLLSAVIGGPQLTSVRMAVNFIDLKQKSREPKSTSPTAKTCNLPSVFCGEVGFINLHY